MYLEEWIKEGIEHARLIEDREFTTIRVLLEVCVDFLFEKCND